MIALSYEVTREKYTDEIMGGETTTSRSWTNSSYPKLAERPVGKKIHNLYTDRLRQFLDRGQYQNDGLMR